MKCMTDTAVEIVPVNLITGTTKVRAFFRCWWGQIENSTFMLGKVFPDKRQYAGTRVVRFGS